MSIHCHINAVRCLVCVPGLVQQDLGGKGDSVCEGVEGVEGGGGDSVRVWREMVIVCVRVCRWEQ